MVLLVLLSASAGRAHASAPAQTQRLPGYLGIEFHDLTSEQAAALHLRDKRGVEVLLVDHDGPGASAGLRPHDLITGLNGHIVVSGEALRRMIHDDGAGVEVRLSVFRNGSPITIRTKLASREDVERRAWARVTQGPPPPPGAIVEGMTGIYVSGPVSTPPPPAATAHIASPPAPAHTQGFIESMLHGPFTGLVLEAMQPQLADYFGAPRGEGLLVQTVENGSPASSGGIHAGDVILSADNQPMHSTSDWSKHLHASKGKPMSLDILRNRQPLTVTLQPDAKKR
jgi:S1-C subfamily serine protease